MTESLKLSDMTLQAINASTTGDFVLKLFNEQGDLVAATSVNKGGFKENGVEDGECPVFKERKNCPFL